MLGLLSSCPALHMSPPVSGARRSLSPRMNFFDKAQEAFGAGDKPLVGGDRVTPFDRWLGLDKELESEKIERVGNSGVTFIDPNDVSSYYSVSLTKPMGIGFVENSGDCKGLVVDEVLTTGSAAASEKPIAAGDQLVAVDSTLVLGNDFDTGLEVRAPIDCHATAPTHTTLVPLYLPPYPRPGQTATQGVGARGHLAWAAATAARGCTRP